MSVIRIEIDADSFDNNHPDILAEGGARVLENVVKSLRSGLVPREGTTMSLLDDGNAVGYMSILPTQVDYLAGFNAIPDEPHPETCGCQDDDSAKIPDGVIYDFEDDTEVGFVSETSETGKSDPSAPKVEAPNPISTLTKAVHDLADAAEFLASLSTLDISTTEEAIKAFLAVPANVAIVSDSLPKATRKMTGEALMEQAMADIFAVIQEKDIPSPSLSQLVDLLFA